MSGSPSPVSGGEDEEARPKFDDSLLEVEEALPMFEESLLELEEQEANQEDGEGFDEDDMYVDGAPEDGEEPTQPVSPPAGTALSQEEGSGPAVQPKFKGGRQLRNRVVSKDRPEPLKKSRSRATMHECPTQALQDKIAKLEEEISTLKSTVQDVLKTAKASKRAGPGPAGVSAGELDAVRSELAGIGRRVTALEEAGRVVEVTMKQQVGPALAVSKKFRTEARAKLDAAEKDGASLSSLKELVSRHTEKLARLEAASGYVQVPSKRPHVEPAPMFDLEPDSAQDATRDRAPAPVFPNLGSDRQYPPRPQGASASSSPSTHRIRAAAGPAPTRAPRSDRNFVLVRISPFPFAQHLPLKEAVCAYLRAAVWPSGFSNLPSCSTLCNDITEVWAELDGRSVVVRTSTADREHELLQIWNSFVRTGVDGCADAVASAFTPKNWVG
ncbi:hypothetical protein D9611_001028 [Ephemerocybe angulata]|nr:hypothetical protein D9611_001028 [Tulosesus angulatus]